MGHCKRDSESLMPRRGTVNRPCLHQKRSACRESVKMAKGNPRKDGTTMKGKGPRIERDTTISFNEEEATAHIWTASQPMYRRLRKMGYCPFEDNERSASFNVPKKCVSVRKPKVLTEKQKTNLTKRAVFMRNALINSREKAPNSSEQGVGSHEVRSSRDKRASLEEL